MPWTSTAISVGGSLLGGLMGGSKAGERAQKDASARAQFAQEANMASAKSAIAPFIANGTEASNKLSYLLGTGGYDQARPTFENEYNRIKDEQGQGFYQKGIRNTNHTAYITAAQRSYEQKLAEWQKGFDKYQAENANGDSEFGSLNKSFTNQDFIRDPGYEARLAEGEKGANRQLAARGGLASGSALKALERYRQDFASNEFGQAYNRDAANKSRIYDFLSGQAGQGLNAIGTSIGVGTNAANNIGNIGINSANQVAQSQQNRNDNQSNAFQGALGNLIYGIERNRPVVGKSTTSGSSEKPWYYSG